MKLVVLAGGYGTRISEETDNKPKPMIEIGGMPIIWHILKYYSSFGINNFIICCGYKGYILKEFFNNYALHRSDVSFDLVNNRVTLHNRSVEEWTVTLVDTGIDTMTGGRLKAVASFLTDDEPFCFTYGDGLSDIDIHELLAFHHAHGKLATLAAVKQPSRFGVLELSGSRVLSFKEKDAESGGYVNGGFFVLNPGVMDLITGPSSIWEGTPLEQLASSGQLEAFTHDGFWQPMDTLRDKRILEDLWQTSSAPWKRW